MSQWNNIRWHHHCAGEGIQYLMSHVELDFLVLVLMMCYLRLMMCYFSLMMPSSDQVHKPMAVHVTEIHMAPIVKIKVGLIDGCLIRH